jgi:oligopeptidase A
MKNPLVQYHRLPPFKRIRFEHIESALDKILLENRQRLRKLLSKKRSFTWKNLMIPLEEMEDQLCRMWSPIGLLHAVMDTEELREIYHRCLPKLSQYNSEVSQNLDLYQAILKLMQSSAFKKLNDAQKKVIKDKLRDFKLSGVTLTPLKKQRFAELLEHHVRLAARFKENVLDATTEWSFLVRDEEKLSGLPDHMLTVLKRKASEKNLQGFLLTLDFPVYQTVISYADDAALREIMYEAYVTRASDQGPDAGIHDNTRVMEELLNIRCELAQLLDFKTYADYSLATKMANSTEEVMSFLSDLVDKVKPVACQELQFLQTFAKQECGVKRLKAWDIAYCSEKLKKKLFNISQEELRPFFSEEKVLAGMLAFVEKLYGLTIEERKNVEIWHENVRFFEVYDQNKKIRGYFYTDLYAREHKQSGAWTDAYCARRKRGLRIQLPVAYLICNFSPPTEERPSLLTHDEVLTLFHEFGHCLHHVLSKVDYINVSGWNGLEWDAVELPSQFMEYFCWQRSVLNLMAEHYKEGKALPEDLLVNLLKSKNFQSALQILRQLVFAVFDFRLHMEFEQNVQGKIQKLLDKVRKEISILPVPKFNRFQHSFSHIFEGSYSAGYYSYLWSEMLSADAFSKFEEKDIFDKETAERFLQCILERGGSSEAMELFVNFRGRKPTIDAMLKYYSIV